MDGTAENPIRAYRQRTGTSLAALARRVETSKATLSRVENGKQAVSVELLPKLTAETGIPGEVLRPDLAALFASEAA